MLHSEERCFIVLTVKYYVKTGRVTMFTTKVLIRFPTHCAHITVDDTGIHVFKYSDKTCDFMYYTHEDQEAAGEYALDALPTVYYYVTVSDD